MKTKSEVQAEITDLEDKGKNKNLFKESEYKALCKRVDFLRTVSFYLESEPRVEFVEKQLSGLQKKKKLIEDGFAEFLKFRPRYNKENSQIKAEYNTQMGMRLILQQIKTSLTS